MTWEPPRRDQVLRDVIAEADSRLDGELPMEVPGVDHTFRDRTTLVSALHVRWHATLTAHVERALAERPDDPEAAVVRGWRRAARELPGTRLVLDRWHREAEGRDLARAERRASRQHQWLAHRAGLAPSDRGVDVEAVALGAELEGAARRYFDPHFRPQRRSLVQRLRAALSS